MADALIQVFDIRWNRSFFEIYFRADSLEQLFLYRVKEHRFIPLETDPLEGEDGAYVARLNIVIAGAREVLSAGQWIICRRIEERLLSDVNVLLAEKPYLMARIERDVRRHNKGVDDEAINALIESEGLGYVADNPYDTHGISYEDEILEDLGRYSRVFRYAKNTYAYTVSLIAKSNAEGNVYLALEPEFFMRNPNPRVRKKSKVFLRKTILSSIYRAILAAVGQDRPGNRILFFKQNGDGPTENMAALQRRIQERGLDGRFDISYRYRNVFSGRQNPFAWIGDLVAIAKSDFIFVDDYTPIFNFIDPPEGCVLTQIWHAGVGFKSVGYARFGLNASPDPYASSHRKYTYALVGNAGLRDIYSEVFGIEEEALLATGMPRLDHFLDEGSARSARSSIYEKYPQLKGHRVILFAPTFRGAGQRSAHYPYKFFDMQALYDMCEKTDSIFVFEMHHFIKKRPPIDEAFANRVLDLSYENLNELFFVSDVLVTDYSSCFYDYLLLDKPVVFFTPDREVYTATRGVQRPIEEMAPGVVCDTFEDFMRVLEEGSYESVEPDPSTIDRAAERSGLASDRAIDAILLGQDVPGVRKSGNE